ncbi:MAG: hypothetical protein ACP5I1_07810, partial [Candidatus Hinthialibacter sp.]
MGNNSSRDIHSQPNRRSFMINSSGMLLAAGFLGTNQGLAADSTISSSARAVSNWLLEEWNPQTPFLVWGKPLRVQPILMYATPQPKKESSWKSWGGVLTEESAAEEIDRITCELRLMAEEAEFPLQIYPPIKVKSPEEAQRALQSERDVTLVYAASGSGSLLEACVPKSGDAVIFVRHRSGPLYYWYEALSVVYLKTDQSEAPVRLGDAHVDDVVVDDYEEVLWRLRALYGVKNLVGCKIVALGGDWGKYAADAPQVARDKFKMEIINIPYEDVEERIKNAMADPILKALAEKWTDKYLSLSQTTLKTDKHFVVNAFILYRVFKELMWEHQTPLFTIKDCMKTIIPISKT